MATRPATLGAVLCLGTYESHTKVSWPYSVFYTRMSNRKILMAFSGSKYHVPTQRIVEDAPNLGVTDVWIYDDIWLREQRPQHWLDSAHLWQRADVKGVNWFAFKPFVILDALNRCGPDDLLFYTDADTYPIADLTPAYDIVARAGHMVFRCCAQYHKWWCTSACFQLCGIPTQDGIPVEKEKYYGVYDMTPPKIVWHGCARFMGFANNEANKEFLREWCRICLIKDATTFDTPPPEKYGRENPELHQHRTEQAIMTNLALKRGWYFWREACQFGECGDDGPQDREQFGQLFFQDGRNSWGPNPMAPGSHFRNIHD